MERYRVDFGATALPFHIAVNAIGMGRGVLCHCHCPHVQIESETIHYLGK